MPVLILLIFAMIAFPQDALAHGGHGIGGFRSGLTHPVLGLDHLLAMVSVGIVSAQIGGRAIWSVPASFVLIMRRLAVMPACIALSSLKSAQLSLWLNKASFCL